MFADRRITQTPVGLEDRRQVAQNRLKTGNN